MSPSQHMRRAGALPMVTGVIALMTGLLAAWAVNEHIQAREQELATQSVVETRARLVAAVDLVAGVRLQHDHLAVRDIPLPWVPGTSFDSRDVDQVLDSILTSDLRAGEILLGMHVKKEEPEPALSELVPAGRRAVTLPANEINAISGLLQQQDLIDLYVSFIHQGQHLTAPLAQGLRVLAIGGSPEIPASITFDASEQEAIKLVAARHTGSLTAMLRHRGDQRISEPVVPEDLAALMGLDRPAVAHRAPVSILYGDRVDTDTDPASAARMLESQRRDAPPFAPSSEVWEAPARPPDTLRFRAPSSAPVAPDSLVQPPHGSAPFPTLRERNIRSTPPSPAFSESL